MVRSESLKGAQIVVIGAGAVGTVVSYRLARAGAQVTAVEPLYPGPGPLPPLLLGSMGSQVPKHYHQLNVLSIRDHQDLADELDDRWPHPRKSRDRVGTQVEGEGSFQPRQRFSVGARHCRGGASHPRLFL